MHKVYEREGVHFYTQVSFERRPSRYQEILSAFVGGSVDLDICTLIIIIFIFISLYMLSLLFINIECNSDQHSNDPDLPQSGERIILGHININSIPNKIGLLGDMIKDKIDILLISETKIDSSFPKEQFRLNGYSDPYRLDRSTDGGGLLLYFQNDITTKRLTLIVDDIECIISEVTISN